VVVLDQPADGLAQAGGDEIGGVSKKDGRLVTCFGVTPIAL
jgi:hypothetical protein